MAEGLFRLFRERNHSIVLKVKVCMSIVALICNLPKESMPTFEIEKLRENYCQVLFIIRSIMYNIATHINSFFFFSYYFLFYYFSCLVIQM